MKLVAYFPLVGRHSKLTRQNAILDAFVKMKRATDCGRFVESEPGFSQLARAIASAEKQKAFLLFVTLGRYARNLDLLNMLKHSEVEFITPDPEERGFTRKALDQLLRAAEEYKFERSEKIRNAMQKAAKNNGEIYGSNRPGHWTRKNNHLRGWKAANEASVQKRTQRCEDAYSSLIPEIASLLKKGESYASIANTLNEAGHITLTGSPFSAGTVFKIFKRLGGKNGKVGRKLGRKAAVAGSH